MSIEIRNISKTFGTFKALDNVSLTVKNGELVALLGPSGSGKTTLLRILAGLEEADPGGGGIFFHNADVARRHVSARGVGFVFQHYALFRHMSVFENIAFGLRVKRRNQRPDKQFISNKVHDLLKLIQLEGMANRYPHQLSGGQRQRVALARALAVEPKVLLLDEPFGALDAKVRKELRSWLRRLHDEIHVTSVFVTHDQEEALEVADRVVVTNLGRIEQIGTPDQVFHRPANEFVMNFLGNVNTFRGRINEGTVQFDSIEMPFSENRRKINGEARIFIRPHDVTIDTTAGGQSALEAAVLRVNTAGPLVRVELITSAGQNLTSEISQERFASMNLEPGGKVYVRPRHIRVFAE
ncbi:MAG: sulfate/molybdate ABC transporter ATP-binding protein [Syntrophales bacterium]|jgi:sulfate transport system ATP-binding protein|nr:sulfate/molybdate ABC transporter ATP-binding protein [Syntrophales bacterium]MCK9527037.1 sulfate/molybdate ABC transporter ATP-binding protein [Syntrophales bacterium]MDX9921838.1 sulfate/molybdate ABC transporter ATP-binding protein [Syntrophales bacterium]